jgi:vacuolar-type H+-ATPase subunit H
LRRAIPSGPHSLQGDKEMAQPKSSRSSSSSRRSSSRGTTKRASTERSTTTKRSSPARGGTATRKRAAPSRRAAAPADEGLQQLTHARELLERAVVLTRDRIQEAMDDAVERGRMTRDDAEQLVQELIKRGRKQTEEVRSDIEQLLGRGAGATGLGDARKRVTGAAKAAGRTPIADRARREVDRARRVAGVGPTFPILGYDDLTAGQVTASLDDLTPAELRKVRDYERRNANRKSVLNAVEKKLA